MFAAQPAKSYVKLLSVHLFSLMDEGEKLLATGGKSFFLSAPLVFRLQQSHDWLNRLSALDPAFPIDTISMIAPPEKGKRVSADYVENVINAVALTLMCLDEYYSVFVSEEDEPLPDTPFMPMMHIVEHDDMSEYMDPCPV